LTIWVINYIFYRFDLIYLVLDKIDKHADLELATHLVSLYAEDSPFSAGVNILVSKKK